MFIQFHVHVPIISGTPGGKGDFGEKGLIGEETYGN